jgi:hypothetical protein
MIMDSKLQFFFQNYEEIQKEQANQRMLQETGTVL